MHRALAPKDPVHLPEVCEDEPPCELPSWCSPPDVALGGALNQFAGFFDLFCLSCSGMELSHQAIQ